MSDCLRKCEEVAFEMGSIGHGSKVCPKLLAGGDFVIVLDLHCYEVVALLCQYDVFELYFEWHDYSMH
jgi:hypothetical protein